MATFYANPNSENELWIERPAIEGLGFRVWHLLFFCSSAACVLIVLVCCCVKFRIPRTKQDIEADYQRKKLAEKFRQRLKLLKNQDMDEMDLQKALELIQEDFRKEQNQNYEYENVNLDFTSVECAKMMQAEAQPSLTPAINPK